MKHLFGVKIKLVVNYVFALLVSLILVFPVVAQEASTKQIINGDNSVSLDLKLSELITRHKLTGTPAANQAIPDINSPKAQLGMKLFYSKALGGEIT